MSVSKFVICEKCKKSLWIGQSSHCFYSGEPHTMKALGDFVFDHSSDSQVDHPIKFVDEYYKDYLPWNTEDGWEEIDADKYKEESKPKKANL